MQLIGEGSEPGNDLFRGRPRSLGGPRCGCRSSPRARATHWSSRKICAFPLAHTVIVCHVDFSQDSEPE
jgi:hypothetical protein